MKHVIFLAIALLIFAEASPVMAGSKPVRAFFLAG